MVDDLAHRSVSLTHREVFQWYIKHYGPEVNLFVDHSQIVELECLRSGIWGAGGHACMRH